MNDNNNSPKNGRNRGGQSLMILLICVLISLISMSAFSGMFSDSTSREISYDKFIQMLDDGEIESVEIHADTVDITPKSDQSYTKITYYTTKTEDNTALTERLARAGVKFERKQASAFVTVLNTILSFVIPFALFMIVISVMMNRMNKGGGVMGVGKSRARTYVTWQVKTRRRSLCRKWWSSFTIPANM